MDVQQRREKARQQKAEALRAFAEGKMDALDLYRVSKTDEYKSVGLIKLWELMAAKEGWTRPRAENILMRNKIKPDSTLRSLRSDKELVRTEALIQMTSDRWEQAPKMPAGYPFGARASLIVKMLAGEGMPVKDFLGALDRGQEHEDAYPAEAGIVAVDYRDDGVLDELFGDDELLDDEPVTSEEVDELFGSDDATDDSVEQELFGEV